MLSKPYANEQQNKLPSWDLPPLIISKYFSEKEEQADRPEKSDQHSLNPKTPISNVPQPFFRKFYIYDTSMIVSALSVIYAGSHLKYS